MMRVIQRNDGIFTHLRDCLELEYAQIDAVMSDFVENDNLPTETSSSFAMESFFGGNEQLERSRRLGVDIWGNDGPDMMSNSLSLFATLRESRPEHKRIEVERLPVDFSKVPF